MHTIFFRSAAPSPFRWSDLCRQLPRSAIVLALITASSRVCFSMQARGEFREIRCADRPKRSSAAALPNAAVPTSNSLAWFLRIAFDQAS
jgi:hypothetical protein